jgi:hypothetical protein
MPWLWMLLQALTTIGLDIAKSVFQVHGFDAEDNVIMAHSCAFSNLPFRPMDRRGKMVLTVLGMVAEMELGFIKARQRDGIERAKSKGDVYNGRKPTIDRSAVHWCERNCPASQYWARLRLSGFGIVRRYWGLRAPLPDSRTAKMK